MFESQEQHAVRGYKAAHAQLTTLIKTVKEGTFYDFCCIECNGSKDDILLWTKLRNMIDAYTEDLTVFSGWTQNEVLELLK